MMLLPLFWHSLVLAATVSASTLPPLFDLGKVINSDFSAALEVTVDVATLTDNTGCNYSDPAFQRLSEALGVSTVRVGGTDGDFTYYDFPSSPATNGSKGPGEFKGPPPPFKRVLTAPVWDDFMGFAEGLNWTVVFGLNAGKYVRVASPGKNVTSSSPWSPAMAKPFIAHNAEHWPTTLRYYEFGNEPDLYFYQFEPLLSFTGSGAQFASDVKVVQETVQNVWKQSANRSVNLSPPQLACCDVMFVPLLGEVGKFEFDFVKAGGLEHVNISTYHFYPLFGNNVDRLFPYNNLDPWYATSQRAVDPLYLDALTGFGETFNKALASGPKGKSKPVWLGETASASFGGEYNVSNRFADTLQLLDKLGLVSRLGHQRVFRQELCARHAKDSAPAYALIDPKGQVSTSYFLFWFVNRLIFTPGSDVAALGSVTRISTLRGYAYRRSVRGKTAETFLTMINLGKGSPVAQLCFTNSPPANGSQVKFWAVEGVSGSESSSALLAQRVRVAGEVLGLQAGAPPSSLPTPMTAELTPLDASSRGSNGWTTLTAEACYTIRAVDANNSYSMTPYSALILQL